MNATFHLATRGQLWIKLLAAVSMSIAAVMAIGSGFYFGIIGAIAAGIASVFHWVEWNKLRQIPNGSIISGSDGLQFIPSTYWGVNLIRWEDVAGMDLEDAVLTLIYKREGIAETLRILRSHFLPAEWKPLVDEIHLRGMPAKEPVPAT